MPKPVILCVDDESIVLQSLRAQLERSLGDAYCYEIAQDADEAIEVINELDAEQTNILVIVSDWLMPGMKGDELLIHIHQEFPQIVKILLTGQADQIAIERAKEEANLHECLFKPWSEEELIKTIKSGIEKL